MKEKQKKDVKVQPRVTENEYAELLLICSKTGVRSPYKLVQIIIHWFLGWWEEMTVDEKEATEDSIRAEIQEEFDRLAEQMDVRGPHFTSDRRNG